MSHIHDKIDFTVDIFIVNKNKVLLRKHDKYKLWLAVGGNIELNEDPNQAAISEVKEEVGLGIKLHGENKIFLDDNGYYGLIPPKFLNRHRINEDHEHVSLIFFATPYTDNLITFQEELSEECKWFNLEELENYDIKESIKFHAKKSLEEFGNENKFF